MKLGDNVRLFKNASNNNRRYIGPGKIVDIKDGKVLITMNNLITVNCKWVDRSMVEVCE